MEVAEKTGYFWSDDVKQAFVFSYFQSGNLKSSAEELKVPYDTVKLWKKQDWFIEACSRFRIEADRATDQKISKLIEKSFSEMEDRLDNGEERILKDGSVVKVKANLAALTIAAGTMFDKRQLLRKAPVQDASSEDILVRLAEKLREFARPVTLDVLDVIRPVTFDAVDVKFKDE